MFYQQVLCRLWANVDNNYSKGEYSMCTVARTPKIEPDLKNEKGPILVGSQNTAITMTFF